MNDITELLRQVGGVALQVTIGMLAVIVLLSLMDRHGRHAKDDPDKRKDPHDGPG